MTIIMVMMASGRQFELIYPPIIKQHLKAIERKYWSFIRNNFETQLRFEPDTETRNRKPLKKPIVYGATWEVRFGSENHFRVYYRIDYEKQAIVILAIGEKMRDRLIIGSEEIEL